jgi:Tol biopolymer transport system component
MNRLIVSAVLVLIVVGATSAHAAEADTYLASAGRNGFSTGYKAEIEAISGSGRFVLFSSRSSEIVKGDTNGARDLFVWDRKTGITERANVSSTGKEMSDTGCHCNIAVHAGDISADGRYVLFGTSAGNLAADDHDESSDGFVHDRSTGRTILVTPGKAYSSPRAISPDGEFVLFYRFLPKGEQTRGWYVFDVKAGTSTRIDTATDGHEELSGEAIAISEGGDKVTFVSSQPETAGDPQPQVFVLDRTRDSIEQASVSSDEQSPDQSSEGGSISPDGRFVVFATAASNIAPLEDTNFVQDVFVRDLESGTTTRATVENGLQPVDGWSWPGEVSDDGCKVAFESDASNLVADDTNNLTDIFVRDMCAETTTRVSVASDGAQATGFSLEAFLSGDGHWAAFQSKAHNLTPGDTNQKYDVFVRGAL